MRGQSLTTLSLHLREHHVTEMKETCMEKTQFALEDSVAITTNDLTMSRTASRANTEQIAFRPP